MANGQLKRESNPVEVDGRKYPMAYPQHETDTPEDFVNTGKRNPLPSKLYAEDENGNKVPLKVSANGEVLTQLTGSNTTLQTNVENFPNQFAVNNFPTTQDVNVLNHPKEKTYALQENFTQADEVNGELTFSENIEAVDIYNLNQTDNVVFAINGLVITVPPATTFESLVGGTSSNVVSVSGVNRDYVIGRLG